MENVQRTLEEVDSLVGNQIASQVLRQVHTAHNASTVSIGAPPEFDEAGAFF